MLLRNGLLQNKFETTLKYLLVVNDVGLLNKQTLLDVENIL